MEENKKPNNSKIIIGVLVALLILIGGYSIYNMQRYKEIETSLKSEKEQIVQDLTKMEHKFNKAIAENTGMSKELKAEKKLIVSFKDSVKNLKHINYRLIRRYRYKLAALTTKNERLLAITDSLKSANQVLLVENTSINNKLTNQISYNDTLVAQNLDLATKVKIGGILKINNLKVAAMRKRSNGTYKNTARAVKTSLIKVTLNIDKNELSTSGDKQIYVVINNTKGDVINAKGTFAAANGPEISYTEDTKFDYKNEPLEVVVLVQLKKKQLKPGVYKVSVYEEGTKIGDTSLTLKDSFLGL